MKMTANMATAVAMVAGAIIISHLFEQSSASAPASSATLEESIDPSYLTKASLKVAPNIDWATFIDVNNQATALAKHEATTSDLAERIRSKYSHVTEQMAQEIAGYAKQYEREVFPKAEDILAVIAIESSFIPTARSNLKKDPAVGLMQVRPGIWKHIYDSNKLYDVEHQIEAGSQILADYYNSVGTRRGALQAYNLGITAYNKGARTEKYIASYRQELALFK